MVDGELVDLEEQFRESAIDLDGPSNLNGSRSRLIDFGQWMSCYTFNNRDEIFNLYTHYWDGVAHDVRLRCGTPGTSGWCYRHIEERHGGEWQEKLEKARSKGWVSEAQGVHSWDDLMAGAAGSAITWPEQIGGNFLNATKCGVTDLYLVDQHRPQVVLMVIKVAAVWALNSDRLISVYPSEKSYC